MFILADNIYHLIIFPMKYFYCLFFIQCIFWASSHAQLEQNTWLVGGNGHFITRKDQSTAAAQIKQRSMTIQPNIGFFIFPKFAGGLKLNLQSNRTEGLNDNFLVKDREYGYGPFIRYYLLSEEQIMNILVDLSYQHNIIKSGAISNEPESELSYYTTRRNIFQIRAGPVFYFNSSVGLETLLSYNYSTIQKYLGQNRYFMFSVGLQIHLKRE